MYFKGLSGRTYQLLATLTGNLLTLNYGLLFGSTSASIMLYQSKDSPLIDSPISDNEASWISSYLCIGAIIGTFFFGFVAEKYGRRTALLLSGLPQMINWLFLVFGYKIIHVHLSRLFGGIAAGAAFGVLPVYISEIAEDHTRGGLGSFVTAFRNLGMVLGFTLGSYVTPLQLSFVGLATAVAFNLLYPYADDTPYYYVMKNNMEMAERTLKHYRGYKSTDIPTDPHFLEELDKLKILRVNLNIQEKQKFEIKTIFRRDIIRPIIISAVLVICAQFCGVYALLNYSKIIFTESGTNLSPDVSGIIMASLQLTAAYIATLIADKVGRRVIISISATTAALSLATFGFITYLKEMGYQKQFFGPLVLFCVFLTVFIVNGGLYPLTYIIIAEVFSPKLKNMFTCTFFAFSWFMSFLVVRYYYLMVEALQFYGCMFLYSGFCVIAALFTLIYIPETRGKSFEQIQKMMGK